MVSKLIANGVLPAIRVGAEYQVPVDAVAAARGGRPLPSGTPTPGQGAVANPNRTRTTASRPDGSQDQASTPAWPAPSPGVAAKDRGAVPAPLARPVCCVSSGPGGVSLLAVLNVRRARFVSTWVAPLHPGAAGVEDTGGRAGLGQGWVRSMCCPDLRRAQPTQHWIRHGATAAPFCAWL
jgi:hypothetical protein